MFKHQHHSSIVLPLLPVWDGLFRRFMNKRRSFFLKNPRLGMLVNTFDKMSAEKKARHLKHAEDYLNQLKAVSKVCEKGT